jgi:hypothetical protein
MKTDQLVDELVADLKPVRTRSLAGDARLLVLLIAVEFGLYWLLGSGRDHMGEAMASIPSFMWKLSSRRGECRRSPALARPH